jgi:hypothetical protein
VDGVCRAEPIYLSGRLFEKIRRLIPDNFPKIGEIGGIGGLNFGI